MLFSIVAVPIYIPTNSARGFPFLHTLSAFVVCRFFDDGHSDWCEVMPHCGYQGIRGEGINWEIGIDIYTLLHIK